MMTDVSKRVNKFILICELATLFYFEWFMSGLQVSLILRISMAALIVRPFHVHLAQVGGNIKVLKSVIFESSREWNFGIRNVEWKSTFQESYKIRIYNLRKYSRVKCSRSKGGGEAADLSESLDRPKIFTQ